MALNKAQLMVAPGGPGVTGAVKQAPGSAVTITDGVASKLATGAAKLVAGANVTLTPPTGIGEVTVAIVPPAYNAVDGDFEAGDLVPFLMSAAPSGWTKQTSLNDGTLRVTTGTGGVAGGATGFSAGMIGYQVDGNVNANVQWTGSTGDTSLTPSGSLQINLPTSSSSLSTGQIAGHQHDYNAIFNGQGQYGARRKSGGSIYFGITVNDSGQGGNQSHLHDLQGTCTLVGNSVSHKHDISSSTQESSALLNGNSKSFAVKYVDLIICKKD